MPEKQIDEGDCIVLSLVPVLVFMQVEEALSILHQTFVLRLHTAQIDVAQVPLLYIGVTLAFRQNWEVHGGMLVTHDYLHPTVVYEEKFDS